MIVFNMYAILVAIFIVIAALPVLLLHYFNVISEDLSMVIASWTTLFACLLARQLKIDGRLFWIPMWILSIPLVPLVTYFKYGWMGIGISVGILAALFGALFYWAFASEKKRMNGLVYESPNVDFDESDPIKSWEAIKEKFFFPTFLKMTPQICAFNQKVAESLASKNFDLVTLQDFKTEMETHAYSMENKVKPNEDIVKSFMNELDKRIANDNSQESERQLAA